MSGPFPVRLARSADAAAINGIVNWAITHTAASFHIEPEPLAAVLSSWRATRERYPWLVATAEDVVIGYAKAGPYRPRAAYDWCAEVSVYVDPHWHGRGVGRGLYTRLIPILWEQGFRALFAGVTTPNRASERLHEAVGFSRVGELPAVGWKFGRWHDVTYYFLRSPSRDAPPALRPVAQVKGAFGLQ